MKPIAAVVTFVTHYLQDSDTLPRFQLRRLGLIYSSYRLIISLFFTLMAYVTAKSESSLFLPSLLQQTALSFYVLLSIVLLGLSYVVTKQFRRMLVFGMAIDVIILSLLLYTNGAPDLQIIMLYMVVVAASFMLLHASQAVVITLLAVLFVIYQQFFYAIANSISLINLGDALLISVSFLAVGFISWSISQRLVQVEKVAAQHAKEVKRLNAINQEVISQMVNGVIVIDEERIVLANQAAYQLLSISNDSDSMSCESGTFSHNSSDNINSDLEDNDFNAIEAALYQSGTLQQPIYNRSLYSFQQRLGQQHPKLLKICLSATIKHSHTFIYELPSVFNASSVSSKLRVQIIPLKDSSQLMILEDLSREQASAQQLKLASLGQFTASIAHEIRNPLAAISQASQLLMEDLTENEANTINGGSDNHELYKMIFAQTKRVNRIIEDILKLSRQKIANQQPIALAEWIPTFLSNYFHNHDVFLRMSTHPVIPFDANQLEQVLINLINNGLRHSSYAHAHAYVEIEIYESHNDVIIDILDDGKGVSADNLQHLFNPFFTTDVTGTGLGLYLSQAFCEANHARLLYVPDHKKTCFRLIAPATNTVL